MTTHSRREFLGRSATIGMAAGVAAGASVAGLTACSNDAAPRARAELAGSAAAPANVIEWRGAHQAGIVTPGPAAALDGRLQDDGADPRDELDATFRALSSEIAALAQGLQPDVAVVGERVSFGDDQPLYPPADNLILGDEPPPDDLTITVGVGGSLFADDAPFALADRRPRELVAMPDFPNDQLDPARTHGDIVVQICAGHDDTCIHALRRIMRATRRTLTLAWMLPGFQRPNTLPVGRTGTWNLLGFKDGTANPDHRSAPLMDELVWVQPGDDEPDWAVGGTYMVVRIIRMKVEFWDRTSLRTQETIMGRHKSSGAPLGRTLEADIPNFDDDPEGTATPLNAHIRLANPRTPATEHSRILRRGFSYSQGFTSAGQLDQGLLFISFQRSLDDGFVAVQRRLDGEALEEYITPVGGGFFYALPGVVRDAPRDRRHLGAELLA